jgi:TolA-binding protein
MICFKVISLTDYRLNSDTLKYQKMNAVKTLRIEELEKEIKEKNEKIKSLNRLIVTNEGVIEEIEHEQSLSRKQSESRTESLKKQYSVIISETEKQNIELRQKINEQEKIKIDLIAKIQVNVTFIFSLYKVKLTS